MERIFEAQFWVKWFVVCVYVLLTFMCFGSAFDRAQDISQIGRFVLAIIGAICIGIATAFYRMEG